MRRRRLREVDGCALPRDPCRNPPGFLQMKAAAPRRACTDARPPPSALPPRESAPLPVRSCPPCPQATSSRHMLMEASARWTWTETETPRARVCGRQLAASGPRVNPTRTRRAQAPLGRHTPLVLNAWSSIHPGLRAVVGLRAFCRRLQVTYCCAGAHSVIGVDAVDLSFQVTVVDGATYPSPPPECNLQVPRAGRSRHHPGGGARGKKSSRHLPTPTFQAGMETRIGHWRRTQLLPARAVTTTTMQRQLRQLRPNTAQSTDRGCSRLTSLRSRRPAKTPAQAEAETRSDRVSVQHTGPAQGPP